MTFIKFCGMTRDEDVRVACDLGVDALGFVLWSGSPRAVSLRRLSDLVGLMPPQVMPVGVFVSPTRAEVADARDAGIRVAQIHAATTTALTTMRRETTGPLQWWRATSLDEQEDDAVTDLTIVLDAHDPVRHGGTGRTIDWTRAAKVAAIRRVMLAGGLTPDNVADAIRKVRPFGVDVSSGIEDRPGMKSAPAMATFVEAVRKEDE